MHVGVCACVCVRACGLARVGVEVVDLAQMLGVCVCVCVVGVARVGVDVVDLGKERREKKRARERGQREKERERVCTLVCARVCMCVVVVARVGVEVVDLAQSVCVCGGGGGIWAVSHGLGLKS